MLPKKIKGKTVHQAYNTLLCVSRPLQETNYQYRSICTVLTFFCKANSVSFFSLLFLTTVFRLQGKHSNIVEHITQDIQLYNRNDLTIKLEKFYCLQFILYNTSASQSQLYSKPQSFAFLRQILASISL